MPIGILSDWGWHSFPNPNGYTLDKFNRCKYQPSPPDAAYLRENQNRFGLGRIGLR